MIIIIVPIFIFKKNNIMRSSPNLLILSACLFTNLLRNFSSLYPPKACSDRSSIIHPPFYITYTHTHTQVVVEYLSEVSWLGLRLETALPNHIAASKSSVYISNHMVACGVLEHSGSSPFHLCALPTHTHPHPPPFALFFPSPLLIPPSFFIYFHQPYLYCCFDWLWAEQPHSFANRSSSFELSVAGQSRLSGAAGSSLMIYLLSGSNLQGFTMWYLFHHA